MPQHDDYSLDGIPPSVMRELMGQTFPLPSPKPDEPSIRPDPPRAVLESEEMVAVEKRRWNMALELLEESRKTLGGLPDGILNSAPLALQATITLFLIEEYANTK